MKIKFQWVTARVSFAYASKDGIDRNTAVDLWLYVGRMVEATDPFLRAWQVKIAWLSISVWWKAKTPLVHDMHDLSKKP